MRSIKENDENNSTDLHVVYKCIATFEAKCTWQCPTAHAAHCYRATVKNFPDPGHGRPSPAVDLPSTCGSENASDVFISPHLCCCSRTWGKNLHESAGWRKWSIGKVPFQQVIIGENEMQRGAGGARMFVPTCFSVMVNSWTRLKGAGEHIVVSTKHLVGGLLP